MAVMRHARTEDKLRSRAQERVFLGVLTLLFTASSVTALLYCMRMSAMPGMPMPGGWQLSMLWMRMPGQTWLDLSATFLGMWSLMMLAMMLPTLAPTLGCYRRNIGAGATPRRNWLTLLVSLGYFLVWTLFGLAIFLPGVAVAHQVISEPLLARQAPAITGFVVFGAGLLQWSPWKLKSLSHCREPWRCGQQSSTFPANSKTAFQCGLRLGFDCCCCCAGQTAALLAIGMMNIGAMVIVTAAITAERLAPDGGTIARFTGGVAAVVGMTIMLRSLA